MKNIRPFFFLLAILIACAARPQKTHEVTRIEYTSLARGYSEQWIFTKDSLITSAVERGVEIQSEKKKINPKDWENLQRSIREITLSEIPDLKSPTMKRAYDGARHGTLSLTTPAGSVSHSFDNEEPHETLQPLMKVVSLLKKQ